MVVNKKLLTNQQMSGYNGVASANERLLLGEQMAIKPLPTKLKKEPIIDAVFEIRFSSSVPASSVIPGFFFARLGMPEWKVDRLPVADLPSQIRLADPTLRYQPLTRIYWDNFLLMVGDSSLMVGCLIPPYPGWTQFQNRIIKAIEYLIESRIIQSIDRYSLKCVNLLEGKDLSEQIATINLEIKIGSHRISKELFTVRLELPHGNFLNVIQISADARAVLLRGGSRQGALVDIDTICNDPTNDTQKFLEKLPARLDEIHIENKKNFFDCLTPETISSLEPIYE